MYGHIKYHQHLGRSSGQIYHRSRSSYNEDCMMTRRALALCVIMAFVLFNMTVVLIPYHLKAVINARFFGLSANYTPPPQNCPYIDRVNNHFTTGLNTCPIFSPTLCGPLNVTISSPPSELPSEFITLDNQNFTVFPSDTKTISEQYKGRTDENQVFSPATHEDAPCFPPYPNSNVAFIIGFRNREEHLAYFLRYNLPVFIRQQLRFKIYVVEQAGNDTFNKAKLMNIGYTLAKQDQLGFQWDCYVFHDVDMIIENDRNMYRCTKSNNPLHLGVAVDKFAYELYYDQLVGGALQVSGKIFEEINGYSNEYWGWGGEDDDIYNRIMKYHRYTIERPDYHLARYRMIKHDHDKKNSMNDFRFKLLKYWAQRHSRDGVRQIMDNTIQWDIVRRENWHAFERIYIDIGPSPMTRNSS